MSFFEVVNHVGKPDCRPYSMLITALIGFVIVSAQDLAIVMSVMS
jgi:hypothetical protein